MPTPVLTRDDVAVLGLAAGVALAGAGRVGAGFLNGDAAAYAAQGWAGDVLGRDVHLAWTALAVALAPLGARLPLALDVVTLAAAVVAVLAAGAIGRRTGVGGLLPAAGAAVAVWPWASFAEVDVPWAAAALVAVAAPTPGVGALALVGAIALSPTAVLAAPWVAMGRMWAHGGWRQAGWAVGAAAVAVAALTVVTRGGWWIGERGVLAYVPVVGARSVPPLVIAALFTPLGDGLARARNLGWLGTVALLVLAPPDVPATMLLAPTLGAIAARVRREDPTGSRWRYAPLLGALVVAWAWAELDAGARARRVADEDRAVRAIAAALGPDDTFVAPWTWGARLAVVATGAPYGRPWRAWPDTVRDQAAAVCGRGWARVAVLPPGQDRVAGALGPGGVVWASAEVLGCGEVDALADPRAP